MQVKVNIMKAVAIPAEPSTGKRSIDYKPGVHLIDDSVFDNWYVQALFKRGIISLVKGKKSEPVAPAIVEPQRVILPTPVEVEPIKIEPESVKKIEEIFIEKQEATIEDDRPEVKSDVATVVIEEKPQLKLRRKKK